MNAKTLPVFRGFVPLFALSLGMSLLATLAVTMTPWVVKDHIRQTVGGVFSTFMQYMQLHPLFMGGVLGLVGLLMVLGSWQVWRQRPRPQAAQSQDEPGQIED